MNKYTNEQLIQVIDTLITNNTEYPIEDFTGGSIGVTLVNNATLLKYKFTIYFGFKNKNAISKVIEVDKSIYNILVDALEIKTKSLLDISSKLSLSDIETILTAGSKVGINTKGTTSTKTNTINTNTINTNTIESKESKIKKAEYSEDFINMWEWYRENNQSPIGDKKKAFAKYKDSVKTYGVEVVKGGINNYVKGLGDTRNKHLVTLLNDDLEEYYNNPTAPRVIDNKTKNKWDENRKRINEYAKEFGHIPQMQNTNDVLDCEAIENGR